MFSVVLGVIESHDFWAFGIIHIVGIVVVFIYKLFDGLSVELSSGDGPIFDFEGG
jgi:hypothetical protein